MLVPVIMLQSLLSRHKKVLVICHEGKSRSVTVTSLFLTCMYDNLLLLSDNFDFVISKRENAKVNDALKLTAFELHDDTEGTGLWNAFITSYSNERNLYQKLKAVSSNLRND